MIGQAIIDNAVLKGTTTGRAKAKYNIRNAMIVPAITRWPNKPDVAGKFVLTGFVVYSDGTNEIHSTRTSLIVNVDIVSGTVETMNSIYTIVE